MAEYSILYGDNDFELRREVPSNYVLITAAKCTVIDDGGTTLQAADSVTVPTATTLAAAITAGAIGGTMQASQPFVAGDLMQFGSAKEGFERRRIATYNSTSGAFTVTERFNSAFANGGAVSACWWTYSLDASGTGYDNLERGTVLWNTFTPEDAIPFTDEFVIINRQAAPAAIRSAFKTRFPHIYQAAADYDTQQWQQIEDDAADRVRVDFAAKGRDSTKMVDSANLEEPHMLMAAYLIVLGAGGEQWADELVRIRDDYNARVEMLIASPFWTDDDQDSVIDEYEDMDAQAPYFVGRGF
ncbi:MAG: hypothetical protein GY851_09215 [bacterium]|nr:hypothetical protein [bacterium]